jgi:putative membrane protein
MSEAPPRTARQWLGLYVRGVVMGMAELVPGVSGGTIAFVTGIYDELIHTLAGLKPSALGEFRLGPIRGLVRIWSTHNLMFLFVLGLGMVTSVVLLAQLLAYALTTIRPVVWGFFLGIIVLSIWLLGRDLPGRTLLALAPVGAMLGLGLTALDPLGGSESLPVFFIVGAIAVSAWLLPAVSGSFVLLTLGLYESVIAALAAPHWDVLAVFLGGCVTGLLLFSRALSLLLNRWRAPLLSLLTGFMAGASGQLWPWQVAGGLTSPAAYTAATGATAYLYLTLLSIGVGALVIWLLSRFES